MKIYIGNERKSNDVKSTVLHVSFLFVVIKTCELKIRKKRQLIQFLKVDYAK